MKNLKKAAILSGLSLENGIRLHKDSIKLWNSESFPSALSLSILAQEEIGKAFLFQEHVFQTRGNQASMTNKEEKMMAKAIMSHQVKQGWFSREVDNYFFKKNIPRFVREITEGKLDIIKQESIYVGLTRKEGKIDLKGKIVYPLKKVKKEYVRRHITRVNDFIIDLAEGCRRQTYCIDTEEMDKVLTINLVAELEKNWPNKSRVAKARLKKIRVFPIEDDD